jgi:hypothetical protein
MKKIYIISAVRAANPQMRAALEAYADICEEAGHIVHLPHRDTNQEASELEICMENGAALQMADEIHVFYDQSSTGSHFDLGMAFMLDMLVGNKKRVVMLQHGVLMGIHSNPRFGFAAMIKEWVKEQLKSGLYSDELEDVVCNYTKIEIT